MKNWEDAEEVAQDVLLKVHRKIDAFRGDAALSSWIYRITFNTAMSRLRRRGSAARTKSRRRTREAGTSRRRSLRTGRRWRMIGCCEPRCGRLIEALTYLPEVYRTPVILRDIQGLSTEEPARSCR